MMQAAKKILLLLLVIGVCSNAKNAHSASNKTDLIVYSYDRPMQLYAFLESLQTYVTGLNDVFVILRASNKEYEKAYQIVEDRFYNVQFLYQKAPFDDLKPLTIQCFLKNNAPYILFGVDDIIIKDCINVEECTNALEEYGAHGFFFRLGKNLNYCFAQNCPQPLPPLIDLPYEMRLWIFNQGTHDWKYPNNLDFTLYRKKDLEDQIKDGNYKSPYSLESQLMGNADMEKHGLCYEATKIINFPLNVIQCDWPNAHASSYTAQDLLVLFNKNLKIDIKALEKIENRSAHCSETHLIQFIPREEPKKEKPIVIVTPTYNNKDWWEWNLTSSLNQKYRNFHIIITDDCSTDGTGDALESYIKTNNLHSKVTLIKNKERRGALYNLYTMIMGCPDDTIIVVADGDDRLHDSEALNRLNDIYSTKEVWLTYGQFIEYPNDVKGWCTPMPAHIVKHNAFRMHPDLPSHLRTFYAWLFKKIKLEDLLDNNGMFYRMSCDYATMLPLIEMAGERHHCFENEIMYIYNNANSMSDHHVSRQLQAHIAQTICNKNKYNRLMQADEHFLENLNNAQTDCIIFCEDNNAFILEQFLVSLKKKVSKGLGTIFVLYRALNNGEELNFLKEKHPDITFLSFNEDYSNFGKTFIETYHESKSNYIIFAQANNEIMGPISLAECIKALEETQAFAFSLLLSKENPNYPVPKHLIVLELTEDLCAWNYGLADGIWACAGSADMVLYRKSDAISDILNLNLISPFDFRGSWANQGDLNKLGLCFKNTRVRKL